ncbi:hypothetical protein ACFVMC_14950 [Nocardia sp. NPDC127579]|uniref:hypothetical protein n=1 Tax=Nocardia sp. NPDC127579 TaxID=3345402 RepID=UPI00362FDCAC
MVIGDERGGAPRWFVFTMGGLILIVAGLCLTLCWALASQGAFVVKALLWAALVGAGLVAAAVGSIGLVRYHAIQLCSAAPLFIAVLGALVWFGVPERVGWEITRGILAEQAVDCVNPGEGTRLGVYRIDSVQRRDGGCLFFIAGNRDRSGFAYFPDSPPVAGYEPFDGRWYRFSENS